MPYPLIPLDPDAPGYPAGPEQLGPDKPVLFHTMPLEGMSACLAAGRLLSTRDCLARPDIRVLGVQASVRARLAVTMRPFLGVVADAVPFSLTPHTRAVFGSCGPVLQHGAERVRRDEIVVVILRLETLRSAGIPLIACDRSPTRSDGVLVQDLLLETLPWHRFRTHQFAGRNADPEELVRYGCEVLAWLGVPLGLVQEVAVADPETARKLNAEAAALGWHLVVRCNPTWFFN